MKANKPPKGFYWMLLWASMPWLLALIMVPSSKFLGNMSQAEAWSLYSSTWTLMSPLIIMIVWICGGWYGRDEENA